MYSSIKSSTQQVSYHIDRSDPRHHENEGSYNRSRRQTRKTTNTMTTGTTRSIAGTQSHDQSCQRQNDIAGINLDSRQFPKLPPQVRRQNKPCNKGHAPSHIAPLQSEQTAHNARNTRDPTCQQKQYCRCNTNHHAARQRRTRREMRPIDTHIHSPKFIFTYINY
ncbi:hypothetical protein NMYAN_100037 [Nitrosomonas nitrosa]|uniref:Uncharacterized protein n=1 Tax=Nitrosomonas nitrosa TaxID=52442 RepID=A0A8H8YX73_9PROT|nr:hypothetical protein NMYAN_100037 [Nitrosomonas nitrosa]